MQIASAASSRRPRPGLPALAAALAAISVLCAVASVAVYAYNTSRIGPRVHYFYGDDLVAGILFPLVGAFLVRRRPANAVGWLLIATSVLGVNALANQYAVAGLIVAPGKLPAAGLAAWIATWGWTPELVVPVLLPLLFPDGTLPSPRWRPFARAAMGCLLLLVVAAMLAPMGIDANHSITNPAGAGPVFTAVVLAMVALAALVLTPVSVLALVLRQRRARGAERAQLQWLSLAAVVTLALGIASGALRQPGQEALWALALAAIPAGIMIAVLRHQLLDIEVVLNRTVVYGLLSAVVLLGYVVAVAGVGPDAQRTGLVTVVVLALLAASARDRVQRAVDRLLFGYRKDPYAVVTRVGQRLDAAAGPLDALQQLTAELRSALRLPSAAVIPDDPRLAPVEAGRPVAGTVDFPVTMQGRQVATLRVGLRHRGARFRPDEQSALTDVGRRVGALVQAAVLVTDLQRSRETLVAAREEERRRLRQDLHDGVGPELAGMALQLDSLASRLGDQADLAGRARVLRDRMRQTVAEVRRVVDDLRPSALDELGLAEALRQHLAVFVVGPAGGPGAAANPTDIVIDPILPPLPSLPAAVEVAAYRIVSEAVANAVRHGQATTCTVRLSAADGQLVLVVTDNGTGIPAAASAGVGLASMHDRAAELGGDLQIETGSAGTVLRGCLPLEVCP